MRGRGEERELRAKARWYLAQGVGVVWLVLPGSREIVVVRPDGESRHGAGDRLPEDPRLPGLAPRPMVSSGSSTDAAGFRSQGWSRRAGWC